MRKIILILCFMPFLLASTCEKDSIDDIACTENIVPGLQVKVSLQNATLPNPSGVTIKAKDGSYSEILKQNVGNINEFYGAFERKGNYILTVSKNGYKTFTSNSIVVTADRCHVIQKTLNVALELE